jgi:hypothetical protein
MYYIFCKSPSDDTWFYLGEEDSKELAENHLIQYHECEVIDTIIIRGEKLEIEEDPIITYHFKILE